MSDKKTVLDMSNDELLESCQQTAASVKFCHNDYYREIERRTKDKNTRVIIWLTVVIGVLTFVATIATVISVIK